MRYKFLALTLSAFISLPAFAEQCQLGATYGFIGCGPTDKCDLRLSSSKGAPKLSCVKVTTRKVARTIIDPKTKEVLRVNGLNKKVALNASGPSKRVQHTKIINKKGLFGWLGAGAMAIAAWNGVERMVDFVQDKVGGEDGNNDCGGKKSGNDSYAQSGYGNG